MPVYYKGSAPGSHWARNDARTGGFFGPALGMSASLAAVNHITRYSSPSPFISLTASFEVAMAYATVGGPAGPASTTNPGFVYTVDLSGLPQKRVHIPAAIISRALGDPRKVLVGIHHSGGQDLIHAVADPGSFASVLSAIPRVAGSSGPVPGHLPPVIQQELEALIFSIRDAEVLVEGPIPSTQIVKRDQVW